MYALIKFDDGIHYVCKSHNIVTKKGIIKAKYSDNRLYAAKVLSKNSK